MQPYFTEDITSHLGLRDASRADQIFKKTEALNKILDKVKRPLIWLTRRTFLNKLFPEKWPSFVSLPISFGFGLIWGSYIGYTMPVDELPPKTIRQSIKPILVVIWWAIEYAVFKLSRSITWSCYCRLRKLYVGFQLRVFTPEQILGHTDLRLLKIDKWQHGLIYVTLQPFSIGNQCPSYMALSYTWGIPTSSDYIWRLSQYICSFWPLSMLSQKRLVICNGKSLHITQNLYNALLQIIILNQSTNATESQYWWIDQICINQLDVDEKNNQVSIMGKIYQQASNVVVWTGHLAYQEINLLKLTLIHLQSSGKREDFGDLYESVQFGYTKEIVVLQFFNTILARRNWFARIWIVQELILAKDLTILLGDFSLPYQLIVDAAKIYKQFYNSKRGMVEASRISPEAIINLLDSREAYNLNVGWTIEEWILVARGRQASDRKDFLYAGAALLAPHERGHFSIDYQKSTEDVLSQFTKRLLKHDQGIEALSLSDRGRATKEWCMFGENSWEINLQFLVPYSPLERARFAASSSNDRGAIKMVHQNGLSALEIKAAIFDSVIFVSDITNLLFGTKVQDLFKILVAMGDTYEWTNESSLVAMARILTASSSTIGDFNSESLARHFTFLLATIVRDRSYEWVPCDRVTTLDTEDGYARAKHILQTGLLHVLQNPKAHWHKPLRMSGNGPDIRKFLVAVQLASPTAQTQDPFTRLVEKTTVGRKLFITTNGAVGIGPASTDLGDKICIVNGSRVPYIIKQRKSIETSPNKTERMIDTWSSVHNRWKSSLPPDFATDIERVRRMTDRRVERNIIKGEAYVHGFMHGEVLESIDSKSISWEKIILT